MSEYVLSLSYGKDSVACLGAIRELGWPLHRVIHAEVWATDTIHADLPPMVEFKSKVDEYIKAEFGIEVEHLCAMRNGEKLTYEKFFYHIPKRKPGGKFPEESFAGFPYTKGAWCNDRLKTNPLDQISKMGGGGICGFPYTIGSWCKKLKDGSYPRLPHSQGKLVYQRSQTPSFLKAPLHKERRQILCSTSALRQTSRSVSRNTTSRGSKCHWLKSVGTKPIADNGAKNGTYSLPFIPPHRGGGCWFCHNQGVDQLRLLRKNYPDLWQLLLKWDKDSPTTFKADGHTVHDYELRFQAEDLGLVPTDRKFRWKMLTGKTFSLCKVSSIKQNLLKMLEE